MRLGILDSGSGGLTVLKAVRQACPWMDIDYIGDTARSPWGNRSKEELRQFNRELIQFLLNKQVDVIINACNTTFSLLSAEYEGWVTKPILGLPPAACRQAVTQTKTHRIAVIATQGTIGSHVYKNLLEKYSEQPLQIFELACPELAGWIESGHIYHPDAMPVLQGYVDQVLQFKPDVLVYACSHYPLIDELFNQLGCQSLIKVDPALTVLQPLSQYVQSSHNYKKGELNVYLTAYSDPFNALFQKVMAENVSITRVTF